MIQDQKAILKLVKSTIKRCKALSLLVRYQLKQRMPIILTKTHVSLGKDQGKARILPSISRYGKSNFYRSAESIPSCLTNISLDFNLSRRK